MADNIAITAGSGTNVATDDVSGVHYQKMKIDVGGDGASEPLIGTSQGLPVIPRRDLQRIAVQSGGLTTGTTAYTAGDQVGTQFTFTNAARSSGGSGTIVGVMMISAADITGAYDLAVYDSSVTVASDNAAWGVSDSDALKMVDLIQLTPFDMGGNRCARAFNLAVPYVCSGGTSLYGGLVTRMDHTFFGAVTDITVILYVERN